MERRNFIKLSLVATTALLVPNLLPAKALNLSEVTFSTGIYNTNNAQTIMIFMYGGASLLGGNLTNIDEIKLASQSDYDNYFSGITKTANNCWQEAGGTHMESLLANGDMTLFRCCYSKVREANNNKSHGLCTVQNQKGSFDDDNAGMVANLAQILEGNGVVNENSVMPFITMEGESKFYAEGKKPLNSYLKPVGIDENLNNPYQRNYMRAWYYYTDDEQTIPNYNNSSLGFDPALQEKIDLLAKNQNSEGKIKDAFSKRTSLDVFVKNIQNASTPDLGLDAYPNNRFAKKIETAIQILSNNIDTKIITLGTGGLGGWDDHNEARDYVSRKENLFKTLRSAMAHLKAMGKEQTVNIMVFSEFGRNVNLNSAFGWDHGNIQNLYVLGGKGYFNHKGVVGETELENTGAINRLFLKPKNGTYQFEPLSIAATLYKIYGVGNPETLTNGNPAIDALFS